MSIKASFSEIIARSLGLPPEEIGDLVFAARVHDVGKLFVPERILNKPGPLTEGEFYVLKMHAEVGGEILATLPEGKHLREAVQHHHESFDGGGYPNGLRGEKIPQWARIMAITDAYVNMTSERSFAAAKTSEQALAELEKIVRQLESGGADLASSITAYERGVELKKLCEAKLKEAQAKIEKITVSADGKVTTEPFKVSE